MPRFIQPIPLALYIHIPWCIQKCPYCDFNSHAVSGEVPEKKYMERLIEDLEQHLPLINSEPIQSIFIGGGTPSLVSPEAYHFLFEALAARLKISADAEITLEANPGTVEQTYFKGYRELGINRISLGLQSLQNDKLKVLGRVHNAEQAVTAVHTAKKVGFDNINLDLMYGLPKQSLEDALYDLESCIALEPKHVSWYQLTLEPNTLFHKYPPPLASDDLIWEMQVKGQELLKKYGYEQYEISAYAKEKKQSLHNLNYWLFGDYLGIGAGAHGKLTDREKGKIYRSVKLKNPKDYLDMNKNPLSSLTEVKLEELPLEFMMNSLRLYSAIPLSLFKERTGLPVSQIETQLASAAQAGFLILKDELVELTPQGHLFLNELLGYFMAD